MIAGFKALFGALFGKAFANLEWLVLLAVAGVAAYFYADGRRVRADRADIEHAAELICAGAGAPFAASIDQEKDKAGKTVTVNHARGALCQRAVLDLARFKADTDAAAAKTLAQALKDHDARQGADTQAARTAAEAARAASERMEAADAKAERTNRVDSDWFAAVNGVAGLRPPDR